ncbi:MAG: glyoxalase/bleomycin resistance/extradiol dioxygenase family protein [Alphaproteobacteria bacterium]|nr:glyoxalase/bleomycin resistance/extradiol dioxygenase family protein [Alphaproteobacteria bacterium]MCB9975595.1 glyoxalase/bleomycin resistance/extradiol dioxygenase family protein [Rhodospirillales bacterium]
MHPIPEGFHTITPTITVEGAADAIELYKQAFDAQELHRLNCPKTGRIVHAGLKIGTSMIFIGDNIAELGCAKSENLKFYLYVPNADKAFEKAKKAGLIEKMPVEDQFWGDRMGALTDKFGVSWTVAHFVKQVSQDEMEKALKQMVEKMAA